LKDNRQSRSAKHAYMYFTARVKRLVRGVARLVPLKCPRCGKSSKYFVYADELLSVAGEPASDRPLRLPGSSVSSVCIRKFHPSSARLIV